MRDEFAPSDGPDGPHIEVIHGIYAYQLPLAGPMKVAGVREWLNARLKVSRKAVAVVDGEEADEGTVLAPGQVVCFVRPAGEMGPDPDDRDEE